MQGLADRCPRHTSVEQPTLPRPHPSQDRRAVLLRPRQRHLLARRRATKPSSQGTGPRGTRPITLTTDGVALDIVHAIPTSTPGIRG
jgi:hypothetical protein